MRLLSAKHIRPGFELAKPIFDEHGRILIQKNIKLTERMINRLHQFGIAYVFIRDEDTDDIVINHPIADEQRIEAIQKIKHTFSSLKKEDLIHNNYLLENIAYRLNDLVVDLAKGLNENKDVLQYLTDLLIIDDYVYAHSLNVTMYTLALAKQLNMKNAQLKELGLGAILHDIGKLAIPDAILNKKEKLTEGEYEIIQTHTEHGFNMLRKSSGVPLTVAHCAYQHHERLDGSGYPRGIKDKELHFYAKVIGVTDVFDAVTSNRVYRDALLPHEGLEILYTGSGTKFEQPIVEAFRKTIALYPNGITVRLNDGREAVVAQQNLHMLHRPIVRVIKENGSKRSPYDLDLTEVLDVMIIKIIH